MLRYYKHIFFILLLTTITIGSYCRPAAAASAGGPDEERLISSLQTDTDKISAERTSKIRDGKRRSSSGYKRWKRTLPFWPRKCWLLLELGIFITIGVIAAQILEVSGAVKYLAVLAWPVTRLGGLGKETGPAFLMAFQSGAVANGMLVSSRNDGSIDNRQLYTSVLVVSCLSLFAHLPTYVGPLLGVIKAEATIALFSVRFAAIIVEIVAVLLISNLLLRPWLAGRATQSSPVQDPAGTEAAQNIIDRGLSRHANRMKTGFWLQVWRRSRRTLKRLLIFLIPSYACMALLEFYGFFSWLTDAVPGLFTLSFLPPQAMVIIPSQAMSLYTGATLAGGFLDDGTLSSWQVVLILLAGSIITAPVRTFKHALPTYIAILGPRPGLTMAICAQVLRSIFLLICTVALWVLWRG
ncbi:MAG: nucleoside recognition protein [Deltaproteobacteria bacterium]|nr:nucleoside recognition protein [Deltaproteobacteria bacterium]